MPVIYTGSGDITNALLFYKSLEDVANQFINPDKDGSILAEFYNIGGMGAAKRLVVTQKSLFVFSGKDLHRFDLNNVQIDFKKSGFLESFSKGAVYISIKAQDSENEKEAVNFFVGQAQKTNGLLSVSCDPKATEAFYKFLMGYIKFINLGLSDYQGKFTTYFKNTNNQLKSAPYLRYGPQQILAWNDDHIFIIEDDLHTLNRSEVEISLYSQGGLDLIKISKGSEVYYVAKYMPGGEINNEKTLEMYNLIIV